MKRCNFETGQAFISDDKSRRQHFWKQRRVIPGNINRCLRTMYNFHSTSATFTCTRKKHFRFSSSTCFCLFSWRSTGMGGVTIHLACSPPRLHNRDLIHVEYLNAKQKHECFVPGWFMLNAKWVIIVISEFLTDYTHLSYDYTTRQNGTQF